MKKTIITALLTLFLVPLLAQQYPEISIKTLQEVNASRLASLQFAVAGQDRTFPDYVFPNFVDTRYRDTVTIEGTVVFDPAAYGLSSSRSRQASFLLTDGGGPWSGVEVMYDSGVSPVQQGVTGFLQNFKRGRKVKVTGVIKDFQGQTQLTLINVPTEVTALGNANVTPFDVIEIKDLVQNINGTQTPQFTTGEQWEGVYVELKNVFVVSDPGNQVNGSRFTWWVQDADGNRLPIRDVSGYYRNDDYDDDPNTPRTPLFNPPPTGSFLSYIRGVIVESGNAGFKTYYIAPLLPNDLAEPIQPPFITNLKKSPGFVKPSDQVTISADITDNGTVQEARLYYAVGYDNNSFNMVSMVKTSGDKHEGIIPAQSNGSIVKYFISARDNEGYWANFPDSTGKNSAYKVLSSLDRIADIQQTPILAGQSLFANDTLTGVSLRGVVMSTSRAYDLGVIGIQDGNDPWSGIFIRWTVGDGLNELERGDSILITKAVVTERIPVGSNPFGRTSSNNGTTFLEGIGKDGWQMFGRCAQQPIATQVPFDSLNATAYYKEPWEGVLLELNDVWIVQKNADSVIGSNFREFGVHPDVTAPIGFRGVAWANDLFTNRTHDSLNMGGVLDKMTSFKGFLANTYGNWKFYPRNRTDMEKAGDVYLPYITLIGSDTLKIFVNENINDPGASACDDFDGDISNRISIDSAFVDKTKEGTYIMLYDVKDNAGNSAVQQERYVIVQKGLSVKQLGNISVNVFPNPAKDVLEVSLSELADKQVLRLYNSQGQMVKQQTLSELNTTVSLANLVSGIYICQIDSKNASITAKIAVVK